MKDLTKFHVKRDGWTTTAVKGGRVGLDGAGV